jgi:fatty-acyl-CoA synthase
METPLTPLEFARRTRKLYGDRVGVVDGDVRLTYEDFFAGCDRWSSALQALGVKQGDRVAYIAPNTREQLESFYAVPQIGAVVVPINYRLTAEDFVYITSHSGSKVLCVHPDYLDAIDGVRDQLRGVEHFVALGSAGGRKGWLEHDAEVARAKPSFKRAEIHESDLLALNYTSGTTA